jgi:RING finger protein 121
LIAIRATRSPIERTTPRLFYKWFLLVHKVSYILGIVGYVGLMLTFLGFNFLFFVSPTVIILNTFFFSKRNHLKFIPIKAALDVSVIVMFYGVYYGVLGRDIAEICSDLMAAKIGVRNNLEQKISLFIKAKL